MILKTIAMNIRLHRVRRGWTQEVLGDLSGMERNQIGLIERCEHQPKVTTLEKVAAAFDIPITELFKSTER